jgi:hypothetical protein
MARVVDASASALSTVVAIGASTVDAARLDTTSQPRPRAIDQLAARAAAALRAGGARGPVLARSRVTLNDVFGPTGGVGREELVLALAHHGVATVVDNDLDSVVRFGTQRAAPARAPEQVVLANAADPTPSGWHRIAVADPLTPAQRQLRDTLSERLSALGTRTLADVGAAARRDPALAALLARANDVPDLPVLAVLLGPTR